MARVHTTVFERELTEETVWVEYTITAFDPGRVSGPPELCYPPEGGEVEIVRVRNATAVIEPTDAELERWADKILEEHDFSDDDREYERDY